MNDEDSKVAMDIIYNAGNAKSTALLAIDKAISGDAIQATQQMNEAKKQLSAAHNTQTQLITREINGEHIEKTILLIHAQDQFMAANTVIELGEKFIKMGASKK